MKRVEIDCKQNDWDDIRYGGPHFLGFEFVVDSSENDKDLEKFLREKLKKYGNPCLSINIYDMEEPKVWTREEMEECIKNNKF